MAELPTNLDKQTLASNPPTNKKGWSPLSAVGIAVLLYLAAQIIGSIIIGVYPSSKGWTAAHTTAWLNGAYIQFVYILIAESLTIAGLVWFMRRRALTFRSIGWKRFKAMFIAYGLSGFAVYFIAYVLLVTVASSAIPDLNVNQQQDVGFNSVYGFGELAVTFISLVVLPPLVEETLFRGFLFTNFRRKLSLVWSTVLVSVLFAAPHLLEAQGGGLLWIGALDTFTLSLVLCVLREKTGSLWSGVVVHALKNGVAFMSLYILHLH